MEGAARRRSVVLFCLRFLLYVAVLMVLWWLLLPQYGALLAHIAGAVLRHGFRVPLELGAVRPEGILNTQSLLVFTVGGRESVLPIAMLVTNVPPYLALVLATLGIGWRRRLGILALGCAILALGHTAFLVYAFRFQLAARAAQESAPAFGEFPMAIAQVFLTLPFLLWLVLAYWDRILPPAEGTPPSAEAPQDSSGP